MEIIVNGESKDIAAPCTVARLLEQLAVPHAGAAVALNDAVVRKARYAETQLQPGDRIEIIRAVGGG